MNRIWIVLILFTSSLHAQSFSGDWQGTLQDKAAHRLMLQIARTSNGSWEATLYRIDQSGVPEAIPSVTVSGSKIRLGLSDGGAYDGTLNSNATTIQGEWKEGQFPPRSVVFQRATKETAWQNLGSDVEPPVTAVDVKIIERAKAILNSPAKWNRADNRQCPDAAITFSLYCSLEKATFEITGKFEHRGSAMQEARFVIDDDLAKGNHYEHRLMDYNNDPKTTFADVQQFFRLLEERVQLRLQQGRAGPGAK
jgi:hypothetical protein